MQKTRAGKILDLIKSPRRISPENYNPNKRIKVLDNKIINLQSDQLDFNNDPCTSKGRNNKMSKRRLDFENLTPRYMPDLGKKPTHPEQYTKKELLVEATKEISEEKNTGLVVQTIQQDYMNDQDSVNVNNGGKVDVAEYFRAELETSQNLEKAVLRLVDEEIMINDVNSINTEDADRVEIEDIAAIFQNELQTSVNLDISSLRLVDQGIIINDVNLMTAKDTDRIDSEDVAENVQAELETSRNLEAAELEPVEPQNFMNADDIDTMDREDVAENVQAELETSRNLEAAELEPVEPQHFMNADDIDRMDREDVAENFHTDLDTSRNPEAVELPAELQNVNNDIHLVIEKETEKVEIGDVVGETLKNNLKTHEKNAIVTEVTDKIIEGDVDISQYKEKKIENFDKNLETKVDTVVIEKAEIRATETKIRLKKKDYNYSEPSTNREKKMKFEVSYMDFLDSDDEPFQYSSSSAAFSSESSSDDSSTKKKLSKKKKLIRKVENIEKKPKKKDKEIENKKRKDRREKHENKQGKTIKAKEMAPNPCIGKKCGNNCEAIDEKRRESLFSYFNNLGSQQRRRDWIGNCVIRKEVGKKHEGESRRSVTNQYYINEGEGRRKVCQKFLTATLGISQKFILYTIDNMQSGFTKSEGRGKHTPKNKTPDIAYEEAKKYIHSLPLLPSHYCRKDSARMYLPQETKSITNLHRLYRKYCEENNIANVLSEKIFMNWFKNTFNIGIHVPKKDKCQSCTKFKNMENKTANDISEHEKHKKEKESSYDRFKFHQKIHVQDKTTLCASFDLQKVLNTPYGDNMLLFYSRKYAVYNFTIYENVTQEGYCYLWGESDAKRGANEIATILQSYIKDVDRRGNIKRLILYCDSCSGQNRNKTVLSMVNYILNKCENLETIQINYLIPGHTYMPVDSVHAMIEKELKHITVWAPSQWPTIIECARKNPKPYHVTKLDGTDFMSWDDIQSKTFNSKGKRILMMKLRVATFKKNKPSIILVKYSFLADTATTEIALNLQDRIEKATIKYCLYPQQRPLSDAKYKDLKNLVTKGIIPKQYRDEYLKLPTSKKIVDYLPQSDEEDDEEITTDCHA